MLVTNPFHLNFEGEGKVGKKGERGTGGKEKHGWK